MSNTASHPSESSPPKAGGLAIAALVCGIVGFCVLPAALVALVCGIIALAKSKPGQPKGMAIAGTVMGGLALLMLPILLAILIPVLAVAKQTGNNMKMSVNAMTVSKGAQVYADGNKLWYPGWTPRGERAKDGASGLAHLLAEAAITPAMLTSPAREAEEFPAARLDPAQLDAWCRKNSALIFLPDFKPTKADLDGVRIESFIDPAMAVNPNRIPVAHGDLSTELLSKEELDRQLKAQFGGTSDQLAAKWRLKQDLGN